MSQFRNDELFYRHPGNPILTPADWPYRVHSVFNPAAVRLKDGTTLLLCRCEDHRGFSHFCAARSSNGLDGWEIDPSPTFSPDPDNYPEELWGVEDPRISFVPSLNQYVVAYTAFSKAGPGVALATTEDFRTFERIGLVMQTDDKDAALFPCQFEGQFALIHRPSSDQGAHMWLSYSPDLKNWGGHRVMMPARKGAWWDANKIGLSPPPIRTEEGWLVLYHGVRKHASGSLYRIGIALFDLEVPDRCLLRGQPWVMGPEANYEIQGDVPYVVFPCGYVVEDNGDTIRLYYGAADSTICMATGSIQRMLDWLKANGSTLTGVAGTEEELEQLSSSPL